MKTKEIQNLMLGDLVIIPQSSDDDECLMIPFYISLINEFGEITLSDDSGELNFSGDELNNIELIPLTAEIMHKNTYDVETNKYAVYVGNGVVQYHIGNDYVVKYDIEKDTYTYE